MGNAKTYNPSGGFTQYEYHQIGDTITASNGVQGKIISKVEAGKENHDGLPLYSNTSEIYFKLSDEKDGNGEYPVEQARVYQDRRAALDFDWGHAHGTHEAGVVHVQEWYMNKNGKWTRRKGERGLSNEEIRRYGEIIKLANPKVRLR